MEQTLLLALGSSQTGYSELSEMERRTSTGNIIGLTNGPL
jgi:hypothetical protein